MKCEAGQYIESSKCVDCPEGWGFLFFVYLEVFYALSQAYFRIFVWNLSHVLRVF